MILKSIHVACVVVSGTLFAYRFYRMRTSNNRVLPVYLKVLPHVNDTVLLAAAIGMLILLRLNPLEVPWLLAKIVTLLAYIFTGAMCMRADPGSRRQTQLFALASGMYFYIVLTALSKQVLPGLLPG